MYRILSTFHAAISPFIDPITKAKIVMLTTEATVHEELLKVVDSGVLESSFGGSDAREFNAEVYFSTTIETDYYTVLPPNAGISDAKVDSSVSVANTVPVVDASSAAEPLAPAADPVPAVVPVIDPVPSTPDAVLPPPPSNSSANSNVDDDVPSKPLSPLPPTPPLHNEAEMQPEGKDTPVSGYEKEVKIIIL